MVCNALWELETMNDKADMVIVYDSDEKCT